MGMWIAVVAPHHEAPRLERVERVFEVGEQALLDRVRRRLDEVAPAARVLGVDVRALVVHVDARPPEVGAEGRIGVAVLLLGRPVAPAVGARERHGHPLEGLRRRQDEGARRGDCAAAVADDEDVLAVAATWIDTSTPGLGVPA